VYNESKDCCVLCCVMDNCSPIELWMLYAEVAVCRNKRSGDYIMVGVDTKRECGIRMLKGWPATA
jgi:hypothetical protein